MDKKLISLLDEEIRKIIKEQSLGDKISSNLSNLPKPDAKPDETRNRLRQISKSFRDSGGRPAIKNFSSLVKSFFNRTSDAVSKVLAGDVSVTSDGLTLAPKIFRDNIDHIKDDESFKVATFGFFFADQANERSRDVVQIRYRPDVLEKMKQFHRQSMKPGLSSIRQTGRVPEQITNLEYLEKVRAFILNNMGLSSSQRWSSLLGGFDVKSEFEKIISNNTRINFEILKLYIIPKFIFGEPFIDIDAIDGSGLTNRSLVNKIRKNKLIGSQAVNTDERIVATISNSIEKQNNLLEAQGFLETLLMSLGESLLVLVPGVGLTLVAGIGAATLLWIGVVLLEAFVLEYDFTGKLRKIIDNCNVLFSDNGVLHEVIDKHLKTLPENIPLPSTDLKTACSKVIEFVDPVDLDIIGEKFNNHPEFGAYENSIKQFKQAIVMLASEIKSKSSEINTDGADNIISLVNETTSNIVNDIGFRYYDDLLTDIAMGKLDKTGFCSGWENILKKFNEIEQLAKKTGSSVSPAALRENNNITKIIDEELKKILFEQTVRLPSPSRARTTDIETGADVVAPGEPGYSPDLPQGSGRQKIDFTAGEEISPEEREELQQLGFEEIEKGRSASKKAKASYIRYERTKKDSDLEEGMRQSRLAADSYQSAAEYLEPIADPKDVKKLKKASASHKRKFEIAKEINPSLGRKVERDFAGEYDHDSKKEEIEQTLSTVEQTLETAKESENIEDRKQAIESTLKVSKDLEEVSDDLDERLKDDDLSEGEKDTLRSNKEEINNIKKDIDEAIDEFKKDNEEEIKQAKEKVDSEKDATGRGNTEGPSWAGGDVATGPEDRKGKGGPGKDGSLPVVGVRKTGSCFGGFFNVDPYGKLNIRTGKPGESSLTAADKTQVDLIRDFNDIAGDIVSSAKTRIDLDYKNKKSRVAGGVSHELFRSFGPHVAAAAKGLFGIVGNSGKSARIYYSLVHGFADDEKVGPRGAPWTVSPDEDIEDTYLAADLQAGVPRLLLHGNLTSGFYNAENAFVIGRGGQQEGASFFNSTIEPIINAMRQVVSTDNCPAGAVVKKRVVRGGKVRIIDTQPTFGNLDFQPSEIPGRVLTAELDRILSTGDPIKASLLFLTSVYYINSILRSGDFSVLQLKE